MLQVLQVHVSSKLVEVRSECEKSPTCYHSNLGWDEDSSLWRTQLRVFSSLCSKWPMNCLYTGIKPQFSHWDEPTWRTTNRGGFLLVSLCLELQEPLQVDSTASGSIAQISNAKEHPNLSPETPFTIDQCLKTAKIYPKIIKHGHSSAIHIHQDDHEHHL